MEHLIEDQSYAHGIAENAVKSMRDRSVFISPCSTV
jgi:hypothetical protein